MEQLPTPLKRYSENEKDSTALQLNAPMDESMEKENPKNPMVLSPVIRSVLGFLKIKDIKNCRLVSREWGSTGRIVLANRAIIHFRKHEDCLSRIPVDFYSCFLNSVTLFGAFKISGQISFQHSSDSGSIPRKSAEHSWTIEELTKFFDERQKCIKELTLSFNYTNEKLEKKIDLMSWISKSPILQKNAKHMTKLEIEHYANMLKIPPLHLIDHIKDLQLSYCEVNLEAGVKIRPVKLLLNYVTFFQDEKKLDRVRVNDFVDLNNTKEVAIISPWRFDEDLGYMREYTKYVLDLRGNTITLDHLDLLSVEIVNGETSQWEIEHLEIIDIPSYPLSNQMQIKELYLHHCDNIDLFNLPNSIQKLALGFSISNIRSTVICSQPIVLDNLQYIRIFNTSDLMGPEKDYSFLSHFKNCPKLTHLKLDDCSGKSAMKVKSRWLPKNLKTMILDSIVVKLLGDSFLNLEKLVIVYGDDLNAMELCAMKIRVDDLILHHDKSDDDYIQMMVNDDLAQFLEIRNRFSFGKRLFVGQLTWGEGQELEDSVLNGLVDEKSSFYVFQNKKGCAISEKAFYLLADIPKHVESV